MGDSRGSRRVSLFEAHNSVMARELGQADEKNNQEIGEKNCFDN